MPKKPVSPVLWLGKVPDNGLMALTIPMIAAMSIVGATSAGHPGWRWIPTLLVYLIGFCFSIVVFDATNTIQKVNEPQEPQSEAATKFQAYAGAIGALLFSICWPIVGAGLIILTFVKDEECASSDPDYGSRSLYTFFILGALLLGLTALIVIRFAVGWSPLVAHMIVGCFLVGLAVFPASGVYAIGSSIRWPSVMLLVALGFIWPLNVVLLWLDLAYDVWNARRIRRQETKKVTASSSSLSQ